MKFDPFGQLKNKLGLGGEIPPQTLPLSVYGKLPIYKDYINVNCDDGPAAEFKKWMNQGFGMTFEQFGGKAVTLTGSYRMLWALEGSKNYAVAVIWGSSDEGGLRKFPISFFTILPKSILAGREFAQGWALLDAIWRGLEEHYSRARGVASIEDFYAEFRSPKIEAISEDVSGSETSFGDWIKGFDETEPEAYAGRLTQGVKTLIAGCRNFGEDGVDLAVRLPLARSIPFSGQVEAWEKVFESNLKKCQPWPSMLIPSGEHEDSPNASSVVLLWRTPKSEDARLLGNDAEEYDFIEDIAGPARDSAVKADGASLDGDWDGWITQVGQS